jgi:hypothetical protein
MTDVMTVGEYPHNPLPGPRMKVTGIGDPDVLHGVTHPARYWHHINWLPPAPSNPILESPMYFPGAAWKGTSGMPQRIDPVVYA